MRPIHPINEATCREQYGKPILVVLKDGGELTGILTGYGNGKLILNGEERSALGSREKSAKKKSARIKKGKAEVAASPIVPFFPTVNPYGAGALALDLEVIALLFVLN
jgi:small nuclear ribonucleoprotein (snRNP)-like protein